MQRGEQSCWDEQLDAARSARCTCDEAALFDFDDHAMHRRWCHTQVALHVLLGGRDAVQLGVAVDEGEVLTL